MGQLFLLVKKNIRLLLRAKSSALIVIFAPLLIILLIGLSYNSSAFFGLNIGIHSDNFEGDVAKIITSLQEQAFKVITYQKLEDCKNDIAFNFVHACVSVPSSLEVSNNTAKEVTFYIDQSRINLVYIIQEALKKEFNLKTQELSEDIITDIFTQIAAAQGSIDVEKVDVQSIKEKSAAAAGTTLTVSSSLTDVVLESSYDTATLDGFQSNMLDKVNTGLSAVDDAQAALVSIANSSSKVTAENELATVEKELNEAKELFENNGTQTYIAVKEALEKLEKQVKNADAILDTAGSDVAEVGSILGEIGTSLDEISTDLETIKGSLGAFAVSDSGTITSPLITKIETVSDEKTNLNYVFPSLLALIVMFLAIMLGDTLVMMEKTSPAYVRNFLIPVKKATFVLATLLSNVLLLAFQLFIILLISIFFLSDSIAQFPLLFLVLLLSATIFTLVGMLIGYLFSSEETGILASISTGSLFLFLSGIILPIEGMSPGLREFISFNPFVITEKLIREVFIFNVNIVSILDDVGILLAYGVFMFIILMMMDTLVASGKKLTKVQKKKAELKGKLFSMKKSKAKPKKARKLSK